MARGRRRVGRTQHAKREFSKVLLACVAAGAVAVTAFALVLMWRTSDLSPLAYLIPSVFAELATATAFYYNKAKAENELKIRKANEPPQGGQAARESARVAEEENISGDV